MLHTNSCDNISVTAVHVCRRPGTDQCIKRTGHNDNDNNRRDHRNKNDDYKVTPTRCDETIDDAREGTYGKRDNSKIIINPGLTADRERLCIALGLTADRERLCIAKTDVMDEQQGYVQL